jgi:hypothetical protein
VHCPQALLQAWCGSRQRWRRSLPGGVAAARKASAPRRECTSNQCSTTRPVALRQFSSFLTEVFTSTSRAERFSAGYVGCDGLEPLTVVRSSTLAWVLLGLSSLGCGGSSPEPEAPSTEAAPAPRATAKEREWLEPIKVVHSMSGDEKQYRTCFMRAMSVRGIVQTRFEVDAEGRVERVVVGRNTLGRDDVADCLAEKLKNAKFDGIGQPAQARWTFVFRLVDPIEPKTLAKRLKKERKLAKDTGIRIEPGSTGKLEPSDIEETTSAGYPLFARCYRDAIQRREQPGGILRFRLVIDESGDLKELVDAGTLLPDPFAVDCIAEGFYAMTFPKPAGGSVEATYQLDVE